MNTIKKWGYLRETKEDAVKAGIDKETGLHRNGLDEYLKIIFPNVDDWIHDKPIGILNGKKCRLRPDYRSESLKLIVEFDGLPHYTNPRNIFKDKNNTRLYQEGGYKVIRIPYFIQLSNEAVRILFGIIVETPLFDESYPSIGIKGNNTPGFLCTLGINRMAEDLLRFPSQMKVNLDYLKFESSRSLEDLTLTGYNLLKDKIRRLKKDKKFL